MLAEILPSVQNIDYTLKTCAAGCSPTSAALACTSCRPAHALLPAAWRRRHYRAIQLPGGTGIVPLVAALAAGNRAMIKMSEFTPRTAALMAEMLRNGFGEDHVAVITGEADIAVLFPASLLTTCCSRLHCCGKLVMRAATDNLTPVTLELGGKSPAIIADDIPLSDIIDRLCFPIAECRADLRGAGLCPDPRGKIETFMQLYKSAFRKMFPVLNYNPHYTS